MAEAADRHLLFGLIALQVGLIDQAQLVAAFQAWALDKGRPLADHLAARGDLDDDDRAAVEALAARHLKKHAGDPEKSLAAIQAGHSTRESLVRLGDAEIEASIARLGSGSTQAGDDADRTATYSVGTATSDGQRFRVLRPHARGGLGAIFVALDSELHREVALKQILEQHADDTVSRQRFLLEAEVTGGLEHPGIVPVYGLGTYGDGRPYYAMRFIRGDSLKEGIERFHADESLKRDPGPRSLESRKRLRRFLDVCNAIEYAHSRGVLHRDIKPGNIVVGKHGETLVVDWGLAKATGKAEPGAEERMLMPKSASGSAETLPGSALGTPAYMSPEQACGDLGHLGPRSDVYSLGATLYCLLAGKPPFDGDAGEVLRKVQAGKIPPPGTLDPSIDRALEAICLKAMAPVPEQRYATARDLADDVDRWLADEPVGAWREPWSRWARRWARRHRTPVAAALVALLAGLVGLGSVAAVQARANDALRRANEATMRALTQVQDEQAKTRAALDQVRTEQARTQAALTRAMEQGQKARRSAGESEAVLNFLLEQVLSAARPRGQEGGLGTETSIRQAVGAAEPKVAESFRNQPTVEAAIRDTLGETYRYLGEWPRAIRQHERALNLRTSALGPDHPNTLVSGNNLALALKAGGRTAEAIALQATSLRRLTATLGPDHPDTLSSRHNLASAYLANGQTAEAVKMHQENLVLATAKLGAVHRHTLQSRNALAASYQAAGLMDEAIALHEETLALRTSTLSATHPDTLVSRNNLAEAYFSADRVGEAIAHHQETLKLRRTQFGPDHPDFSVSMGNLAKSYRAAGRLDEAIPLFDLALKSFQSKLGSEHPYTLTTMNYLAESYLDGKRWTEAEPILRQSLMIRQRIQPDHWLSFSTRGLLGGSLLGQKRFAEAQPLIIQGYEGLKAHEAKIPAPGKKRLAEAAERVVRLYETWGKPEQAAEWKAKLGLPDLPAELFAPL